MAAATMTRWSEARTFYSFFICFGLVLYWTCGELDELFWRLPVQGGSQNSHYIIKPYNTFVG
jgi:hypothetical protein